MAPKIPFDVAGRVLRVGDTVAYPMKNGMFVILRLGRIVSIDLTRTKPFVSIQRHIWKPKFLWVIRADNVAWIQSPPEPPEIVEFVTPPRHNAKELTFAREAVGTDGSSHLVAPDLGGAPHLSISEDTLRVMD